MRRTIAVLTMTVAGIVATSCTPDTRAAEAEAIRVLDEQWSAAAGKLDVDATVAYYADDAVVLPPHATIVKDPKSIRESWAGLLLPGNSISWKATRIEVAKSGELGYLYGTYSLSMKDPQGGPAVNDTGKMVEIWKKQADGKWKCIVDTYNSDLPLPAPPPAKR